MSSVWLMGFAKEEMQEFNYVFKCVYYKYGDEYQVLHFWDWYYENSENWPSCFRVDEKTYNDIKFILEQEIIATAGLFGGQSNFKCCIDFLLSLHYEKYTQKTLFMESVLNNKYNEYVIEKNLVYSNYNR